MSDCEVSAMEEFMAQPDLRRYEKHPKCLGYKIWTACGYEYDCEYGSVLSCEECKYGPYPDKHSKDPAAKCNQI